MELYKKLFEAKKEIGKISKDSKNPFYKSKYFDINQLLEHVEPVLQKHGLLLLQPIEAEWVKTKIIDIESTEFVTSEIHLGNMNDPQKLGSAITYYRRYTLQSLLGLQAEDDDANKASRPEAKTYPKHTTTEAPLDLQKLKNKLEACDTLELLASTYKGLTTLEQKLTAKIATELKELLTKKSA